MKHLNLTVKIRTLTAYLLLCLLLTGCFDSAFRLEQSIKEAIVQAREGQSSAAINKLESLQDKHPENADVAEALAIAYEERGNFLLASNYYNKSARLSDEKKYLKLNSARNLLIAERKEDAVSRLQDYLNDFPEHGEAWLELGRIQRDLNQSDEAVNSFTRGILLSKEEDHRSEDHLALGEIYLKKTDFPQADYYLNQALEIAGDSNSEGEALRGLIESSVQQEDWDVADVLLNRLENVSPDIYAVSRVQDLKLKVAAVFATRMLDRQSESDIQKVEGKELDEEQAAEFDQQQSDKSVAGIEVGEPEQAVEELDEQNKPAGSVPPVDQSVVEVTEVDDVSKQGSVPVKKVDVVTPVQVDVESEAVEESLDGLNQPYVAPENEAELLVIHAKQLIEEGEYSKAIHVAWDSINGNGESPSAWYMLSYAYSRYGQYLNAESAALEAMRLNPDNKKIVMQYLRVLQYSRSSLRFHDELLGAYQRFNKDPDFVLALARSYARIKNDPENAAALYRRFLDLEPDDARVAKVHEEMTLVE